MKKYSKSGWLLLVIGGVSACRPNHDITRSVYVGGATCVSCHQEESEAWTGSHHDLAMQDATPATVLGDFRNVSVPGKETSFAFSRRGQSYFVSTVEKDGEPHEYRIDFTFGVDPLQQYLVTLPDGRLQAIPVAWDTRTTEEGGQRWFNLYPDESIEYGDPLHWAGPNQNWNYMCADCHSTHLEKNYVLTENAYRTSWSDIDVSCEACHGPGSAHIKWASTVRKNSNKATTTGSENGKGFRVLFPDPEKDDWEFIPGTGNASRKGDRNSSGLMDTCARCHSRRTQIKEGYEPGQALLDYYRPVVLEEGLYYPDGQIEEEVYVYGSFLQSKMYAAGVTCSNCHDAHSLKLKASGNALCSNCHQSSKYDSESHHFHPVESTGAKCVNCHMRATTYMQVDPRRDHSFQIPRPALSGRVRSPNACNACHQDKTIDWAEQWSNTWYQSDRSSETGFADVIYKGRRTEPGADPMLAALVSDTLQPGIIRSTALALLANYQSAFSVQAEQKGVGDPDPLVRLAALRSLAQAEPAIRIQLALPLLRDSIRAVRIEAARILAPISKDGVFQEQSKEWSRVIEEYVASEMTNADRPEAHLNLGLLYLGRGDIDRAEDSFQQALVVDPNSIPARINLSDLYRIQDDDQKGESVLREALDLSPEAGEVHHALGLNLIRQKRYSEALEALGKAASLSPEIPRFGYVYAVALLSADDRQAALAVLERTHKLHPRDFDVLLALATIHRDNGSSELARMYATRLVAIAPQDHRARQLLEELGIE